MPGVSVGARLAHLLHRFARGDSGHAGEFDRVARPILSRFANRYGWFLAGDKREEIVQQAFLLLRGPAGLQFNRKRGSPKAFLRLVARRAVREVGAMYTSPGARTRPPKRRASAAASPPAVVSIEEVTEKDLPSVEGPERLVELAHDARVILKTAPAEVATALERIYFLDVPVHHVAAEMAVSRYTLDRKIQKFTREFIA